jgi:protoporphyrin/coproporphyrin ferrochelatase
MGYLTEPPYRHGTLPRIGILLINLGTPDAPTAQALRPYLREFLSDPRVVEIPRLVWWPILHGIILTTRPKKSAEKYAAIWAPEGSPLRVHTERQTKLLKGWLGDRIRQPLSVEYAMRYGSPSIHRSIAKLKQDNCDRILVLPLYPQYAASSSGTALDEVFRVLQQVRNQPEIRTVRHFHDHPAYISALAAAVHEHWMTHGRPEKLVMSFHGVPRFTLDRGDPYHCECRKTGRLLAEALGLPADKYVVAFQSRFGRAEWLKPYTSEVLAELGHVRTRRADVICPGFVADCLETLEEIALEGKATYLNAGGGEFHYIPALNERNEWLGALTQIAMEQLQGWIRTDWNAGAAMAEAEQSALRAAALGAEPGR